MGTLTWIRSSRLAGITSWPIRPCIDAAAPASDDDADQLDMDFEPRVVGAGVDMGADEWVDSDADAMPDFWELAHSRFAHLHGA